MSSDAAVSRLGEGDAEGGAPRGRTTATPHHKVNYLLVFGMLIVLTVITVVVAFKRFDNDWYNLGVALLVASVKALLVAYFFMHLKFEGKLIRLTLLFPLLLCIIMIAALVPDLVWERSGKEAIQEYDKPVPAAVAPAR